MLWSRSEALWLKAVVCVVACLIGGATAVAASLEVELLDDDLTVTTGVWSKLTATEVELTSQAGERAVTPREAVVRLRWAEVQPGPGMRVLLADGQSLAGSWVGSQEDGQVLQWSHAVLGEVLVGLETIRGVAWEGADDNAAWTQLQQEDPTSDVVLLANGERLIGFVEALADDHVLMMLDGADAASRVPLTNVLGVRLANPATLPAAGTSRMILTDGSVLDVQDVTGDATSMTCSVALAGSSKHDFSLGGIAELTMGRADGTRLSGLHVWPRTVVSGGQVFGVAMMPRVQAGQLWLHAPVTVDIELPQGTRRVRVELALDQRGLDKSEAAWADVEVSLALLAEPDPQEPAASSWSVRLQPQSPAASHVMDVTPGRLRMTLDPGVNGPVLDRVRIDGVILVEPPDA